MAGGPPEPSRGCQSEAQWWQMYSDLFVHRFWSDLGDNYWIWQIEKNSQVLLSYDEFLSSMKTNKYGGIAASIFAFIVSGVAAWALVKQTTS